ncbi:cation:proton antiporter regulatory subunit [Neosynechococcus sphagnicola]|uniref:cation:proton antiporter regulatory subunit n=1 Tax=Neosynechococcus sphagnicola TaxID=1501145 RepID=UPI00195541B6|nr:TrkA C-terminal domain-containing protein [Neosynechococcus sphagnicola]
MVIRRDNGEEVDYPDSQTLLESGDRLLLVGEPAELAALDELARGERTLPGVGSSCQWLTIPLESPVIGQTLATLDIRRQFDTQVQAIRRQGQFIRFPAGDVDLQAGDRLLLCGSYKALSHVEQLVASPLPQLSIPLLPEATIPDMLLNRLTTEPSPAATLTTEVNGCSLNNGSPR